jgi:hypothetical protein
MEVVRLEIEVYSGQYPISNGTWKYWCSDVQKKGLQTNHHARRGKKKKTGLIRRIPSLALQLFVVQVET